MPTEPTTTDLQLLIAADLAASNDLASRITQLRNAIDSGQPPPRKTVDLMDRSNRDITRDLVRRIEDIESATPPTKDRELLQALNARLAVCDGLAMRLAELRDLITSVTKGSNAGKNNSSPNNRSISAPAIDTDAPERQRSAHPARFKSHDSDPENGDDDGEEEEKNASSDSPSDPDPEPDPKTYPLLYRILSIPPSTPASLMPSVAKSALAALALKHSPRNFPNDPGAPARWAAITRAYEVLSDEGRRAFYDRFGGEGGLEGFDVGCLEQEG